MDTKIIETCLICGEYMGPFKNDLNVCTGFSEKPIYHLFETFMGIKLELEVIETSGICQNCFIKFNEIDEHQLIINKIQNDLLELFNATQANICDTKTEAKIVNEVEDEILEVFVQDEIYSEQEEFICETIEDDEAMIGTNVKRKRGPKKKKNLDEGLIMVEVDGQKMYQCEICQKICKDRYKLKNHKETHNVERNICCTECGAMFKTLSCLYSHKKIHKARIYHSCDLCGMKYIQKTQLAKHMNAIHLKRKDYTCNICGKSYSRDTTLSKHMFVHKEEKDMVCTVCGFRTHTKPKLDRHMKSHTGERNYACEICGKKFLYSYNVIAHVKYVHNREKRPYDEAKLTCQFCGRKFQKVWKKKEHLLQAHKIIEAVEGDDLIVEGVEEKN
ncbi:hypothetical protein PVAND_015256 [Polypedilum vanderplanki]|uniref:C2H2-type domain-containing protein n=1 Tax=Polypedilum vanderplanki TaxID=319348 RepID=A0A9J6BC35_POLVA|nr:hypothetical protein PVAND_015256 [Polypedilum vanderplanki]